MRTIARARGDFEPPGPVLDAASQAARNAELRWVADVLGQQIPAETYLDPTVNAGVLEVSDGAWPLAPRRHGHRTAAPRRPHHGPGCAG